MGDLVNFGIVGLGHIGLRHAKHVVENKRALLKSVCDILPIQNLDISTHKIAFHSNYLDMLNDDEVDVVNICTPNYLHASMAIDVLKSGKHVLIEKPMALSTIDSKKIIETSKKENKLVFCVMQNRFSPTIEWLKKIVTEGNLGKIKMISVNCFWNRNNDYYQKSNWHGSLEKDGGPLFTQFSHFIDVIFWLFGAIKYVDTNFYNFNKKKFIEFEDSGIVRLDFQNDIKGIIQYSTAIWNKNFESSITVIGDRGTVKIGGQYMDELLYCDIENYKAPKFENKIFCNDYGTYKGSASNHDKVIDNVISVLKDKKSINTTALDGHNVVKIIEKIYLNRN